MRTPLRVGAVRVKILVEFDVAALDPPEDDDAELTEEVAKTAASTAAWDFLCFCTAIDANPGREDCEVHVDGHGTFKVTMGEEHD